MDLEPRYSVAAGGAVRAEGLGSLADALDRVLRKGVVVDGAVTIGVAGVELILLDLRLLLASVDTVRPEGGPFFTASDDFVAPPRPPRPAPTAAPRPASPGRAADGGGESIAASRLAPPVPPTEEAIGRKKPQQGLIKLVLTLVNLLHEVLERQAIWRMGSGTLTPDEVERVGEALHAQAMEIARLRDQFGLSEADLTLRLSATG